MARTTLDLDDGLVDEAVAIADAPSKRSAVEEALREFIKVRKRRKLLDLMGKIDLDLTPEDIKKMRGRV